MPNGTSKASRFLHATSHLHANGEKEKRIVGHIISGLKIPYPGSKCL
jgi:hypothetical protein